MSYQSTILVQCEDSQTKLQNVFTRTSAGVNDPIPFLEYINSPMNKNGIDMAINPGGGKTKTYNLTYFQRMLEDGVSAASERGCEATQKVGNLEAQYQIDTTALLKSQELIAAKDLARFCENNSEYIAERIVAHMNVIDRKVASQTATEATAILGGWSDDTEANYTITNDALIVATQSSGSIVPGAWEDITSAANATGYTGVIGFGGNLLRQHLALSLAGCCANQGLDVAEIYNMYGFAFAYDRRLATALGSASTQNLIMEPGAFQLLNYTETPWKDGLDFSAGYLAQEMTTPAGVKVDVYMKDDCGALSIAMYANTKLVGLPNDMFQTGDNFDGVNFTGQVTVTNS